MSWNLNKLHAKNYSKQEAVVRESRICKAVPIKIKITKLLIFFHNGLDLKIGAFIECILRVTIFQSWKWGCLLSVFNPRLNISANFHPWQPCQTVIIYSDIQMFIISYTKDFSAVMIFVFSSYLLLYSHTSRSAKNKRFVSLMLAYIYSNLIQEKKNTDISQETMKSWWIYRMG